MTSTTTVYDLSQILNYPIRVEVNRWDSEHPLRWASYNDEGQIASGQFLEPPGLPLFTLEDDKGRRLCDALPKPVSAVTALRPAMDFVLAQACASTKSMAGLNAVTADTGFGRASHRRLPLSSSSVNSGNPGGSRNWPEAI